MLIVLMTGSSRIVNVVDMMRPGPSPDRPPRGRFAGRIGDRMSLPESSFGWMRERLGHRSGARLAAERVEMSMALNKQQRDRLPSTLERSPAKAQATYIHTLESAEQTHGDGEAAHRIALSALKHSFEKVGDHWEPKQSKGPSDRQASRSGSSARRRPSETAEGVDANASKRHLTDIARRLDVHGRSTMTKTELVQAIEKANRSASARARTS